MLIDYIPVAYQNLFIKKGQLVADPFIILTQMLSYLTVS